MDSDLINTMIISFMKEQNQFNLQIIERLSRAEVRIYFVLVVVSFIASIISKYFLP